MKTAEEILRDKVHLYFSSHYDSDGESEGAEWHTHKATMNSILKAMEEHTQAHTEGLRKENARFKKAFADATAEKLALRERVKELEEGLKPIANTHDAAIEIDPIGIAYKMRNAAEKALKKALK